MLRRTFVFLAGLIAFGICAPDASQSQSIHTEGEGQDIYGNLDIGPGETIVAHDDIWVHGSILNQGSVLIPFNQFWAEQRLENSGLIEMYDGLCSGDEILENLIGGEIKGYGAIYSFGGINNSGFLRTLAGSLMIYSPQGVSNAGTFRSSPSTSLTIVTEVPHISNQGTIDIELDGAVVFDCNLVNEPNAVIRLRRGTLAAQTITQSAGAILEGFGGISGDVLIDPNGIVKLTGPTNIVGDVKIAQGAIWEIGDGTTLVTGHTTCDGTIHMKGGRIIPQGGLSGECEIIWEPGAYTNPADFDFDGKVGMKDFAAFADVWLWEHALLL